MLNSWGGGLLCLIFVQLFWGGYRTYGIFGVPWLVLYTIQIHHVVPMMIYSLAYCGLQILFLVGLAVCGCSLNIQIYVCNMIGGDEFLID